MHRGPGPSRSYLVMERKVKKPEPVTKDQIPNTPDGIEKWIPTLQKWNMEYDKENGAWTVPGTTAVITNAMLRGGAFTTPTDLDTFLAAVFELRENGGA